MTFLPVRETTCPEPFRLHGGRSFSLLSLVFPFSVRKIRLERLSFAHGLRTQHCSVPSFLLLCTRKCFRSLGKGRENADRKWSKYSLNTNYIMVCIIRRKMSRNLFASSDNLQIYFASSDNRVSNRSFLVFPGIFVGYSPLKQALQNPFLPARQCNCSNRYTYSSTGK